MVAHIANQTAFNDLRFIGWEHDPTSDAAGSLTTKYYEHQCGPHRSRQAMSQVTGKGDIALGLAPPRRGTVVVTGMFHKGSIALDAGLSLQTSGSPACQKRTFYLVFTPATLLFVRGE
jgi:hypothetical protein